jgi:RimJ/RimL family protein N-acetyltransferase
MTVLTTERLTLTPVAVGDFDDQKRLWADREFTRHIVPDGRNAEEVWLRLLRDVGHWSALGYGNWTVRLSDTGEYVGGVGVFDFQRVITPAFDAPEVGWGIAPQYQGQGLAGEALAAVLAFCDAALQLPVTLCMIDPDNGPSLRLAARAGFVERLRTAYKGDAVILLERLRP